MKKLFLIPLMAMLCTVMAWGNVAKIGNTEYATLQAAINAASAGQTVELIDNVTLTNFVNIDKSITLDGHGYKISGYGTGNLGGTAPTGNKNIVLAINYDACINTTATGKTAEEQAAAALKTIEVTLKDVEILCTSSARTYGIVVYDGVASLEMNNVNVLNNSNGDFIPVCITGDKTTAIDWTMVNSYIKSSNGTYPAYLLKPINATLTNSTIEGYCGLYFKYQYGVYGATCGTRGSVFDIDACAFNCPNTLNGASNNFAIFPIEDEGITLNLNNCSFNASTLGSKGDAYQRFVNLQYWARGGDAPTPQNVKVTISGDNTHLYGVTYSKVIHNAWSMKQGSPSLSEGDNNSFVDVDADNFIVEITGGTFTFDPKDVKWVLKSDNIIRQDNYYGGSGRITIDTDVYEVNEVSQGGTTVYRVVKKAAEKTPGVLYDLNDLVAGEGVDEGNNPVSSFELSTGNTMELDKDREVTTAGYVQIKDNEDSGDATVVKVGTTADGDPTQKVDQILVVNNGLDVQGTSKVDVQAGSALVVGDGGIVTANSGNIVLNADKNDGCASLLLDPTVTVNQTPELTVKMKAEQIGTDGVDYYWHRFAMPVMHIDSWEKTGSLVGTTYPTYIYGWDYANNDWLKLPGGVSDMVPLMGYTLTLASDEIGSGITTLQDVTYIFKGNLVGNTNQPLNFTAEGFNFFGNSYTGYIDVLTLIQGFGSDKVEGTVYMWCNDPGDTENYQSYVGVPLYKLQNPTQRARLEDWQKEVAPMQTFILRLRGADRAEEEVDYASAIWGNPRYTGSTAAAAAPRRVAATNNEEAYMEIVVKAANGKGSRVDFTQDANHNDAFESGYDVVKYMNERTINLYATINDEDFSSVVTNTLNGKLLSLQTNDEVNYTMSFKNVEGTQYAILDHATNQMTVIAEGNTYQFVAQPNSTVEGRFEIVSINHMPTDVETVENAPVVRGIYTVTGQYVGENLETLPKGVYVIDGVKIVK